MDDSRGEPIVTDDDDAVHRRRLATEVRFLKGVGPKRADVFERMGLRTARDLLFDFPRTYERLDPSTAVDALEAGRPATIHGRLTSLQQRLTSKGTHLIGALVDTGAERVRVLWFNQPYLWQKLFEGQRVLVSGKPKIDGIRWAFPNPKLIFLRDDESLPESSILPVYRLTEGLQQHHRRRAIQRVLEEFLQDVVEVLPDWLLSRQGWMGIRESLTQIHQPTDEAQLEQARRRLVLQELLVLQLALALRRRKLELNAQATPMPRDTLIDARIRRLFPFELTEDQSRAIDEIANDMARSIPMNRLLQGDVGAGKTVVAFYAMLLAVAHGQQAVLMAPTEILATQHAKGLRRLLSQSKVQVGQLTGGISESERRKVLAGVADGSIELLVGTHAVISPSLEFDRLGLVIVDEQHKFGVKQRARLREAGVDPHYLVMTATPIPRTMTMTVFGDLDVSTLRKGPPRRQKVHTYIGLEEQREKWWEFFCKKLDEGRQGYVVTPMVDEDPNGSLVSVKAAFEQLANGPLAQYRIDLLHGRQSPAEKADAMLRFATGETQVIVATSVVEVGVDIPNATLMTIESAERFGLSQLHQLRGRISRGTFPGYVCAFASAETPEAQARLKAFESTTDGFELAEMDFRLRGPGDLLGTKQSGMPPLRIADLVRDAERVVEAREIAAQMLMDDPMLEAEACRRLKRQVLGRYGAVLELGDVG